MDGYAAAAVQTWQDNDGNGVRDHAEPALPWISVGMAYQSALTDADGQAGLVVFKPGCACRCWQGEAVWALPPPGYRLTTPASFELTGPDLTYAFGFQPQAGLDMASFAGEPDWFRAFLNRGLDLVAFHYSAADQRLSVAFNTAGISPDVLYADVFEILLALEQVGQVSVAHLEITSLPRNQVVACEMETVKAWTGRLSAGEIVSRYCSAP